MSKIFESGAIAEFLGLKAPWCLLDTAAVLGETEFAGSKLFTVNELFFAGHFPEHPIVPGVLQIESMRQLVLFGLRDSGRKYFVKELSKVKFRRPVLPGDRVALKCLITENTGDTVVCKASCTNASGLCSESVIKLVEADFQPPEPVLLPEWDELDQKDGIAMNTEALLKLMPHRFPFLLIDYIAKIEGEKVQAVKNFTRNEPIFSCGFNSVPPTLLCEIAAQSGCARVLSQPENKGKLALFMSVDKVEFFRPVWPGERLVADFVLPPIKSRFGKANGVLKAGNEKVVDITLMFAVVDAN